MLKETRYFKIFSIDFKISYTLTVFFMFVAQLVRAVMMSLLLCFLNVIQNFLNKSTYLLKKKHTFLFMRIESVLLMLDSLSQFL